MIHGANGSSFERIDMECLKLHSVFLLSTPFNFSYLMQMLSHSDEL